MFRYEFHCIRYWLFESRHTLSVHLAVSSLPRLDVFDFAGELYVRFSWGAGLESHTATPQGALVE